MSVVEEHRGFKPFRVDLYLQIRRGWISVTDLKSHRTFATPSAVIVPAVGGVPAARFATQEERAQADAVGWTRGQAVLQDGAGARAGTVIDGFSHPRIVVGDWHAAEFAVALAWRAVRPNQWTGVRGLLIHLQDEEPEGGLTVVEMRALRDLCAAVDARRFRLYLRPRELAPEEARRLLYADERDPDLTV